MPARRSERVRADCRHSRIIVGRLTGHMLKNLFQGLRRIFPGCVMLGQAIAFSMFLAFFPMLLFALGVLANTPFLHTALREIPGRLRLILPPGSADVVSAYFVRKGVHPWKWMALGLGGTLVAGSQVMLGFMEGFRIIHGATSRPGYLRNHARALVLLCLTIVPMLPVVVLTVFGRQARTALVQRTGLPHLIHNVEFVFYAAIVFVLAMVVLVALYHIGRPGHEGYRNLLPGAAVATILWWAADIIFGFYVRKMPYDVVYGGLAAAIGLLVWMYLTAMIVLLGEAYNVAACSSAARGGSRVRGR
jgi:membrane protein